MFAPRASDVDFVNDVHCVNDVTPDGVVANITSLRDLASNIITSEANNIIFALAKTSLPKKSRHTRFFLPLCPLGASDVDFVSDVHYVNDVTPVGVVGKNHITASIYLHSKWRATSLCIA